MKKKIILVVIILLVSLAGYIKLTSSHDDCNAPISYASIQALEDDLNIEFFPLYNLETFITENKLVLLNDLNETTEITGSKEKDTISYTLYNYDSPAFFYEVSINPTFNRNADLQGTKICDGILYQYDCYEENELHHIAIFTKDNFELYLVFNNTDYQIDDKILEDKITAYIEATC